MERSALRPGSVLKSPQEINLAPASESNFGIYVGRLLRWTNWDRVGDFGPIVSDVFAGMADPFADRKTWSFANLFGTFST